MSNLEAFFLKNCLSRRVYNLSRPVLLTLGVLIDRLGVVQILRQHPEVGGRDVDRLPAVARAACPETKLCVAALESAPRKGELRVLSASVWSLEQCLVRGGGGSLFVNKSTNDEKRIKPLAAV